jgi:hypothetical protein
MQDDVHRIEPFWEASVILERKPVTNEVLRARVTCDPNGDALTLSGAEWQQVQTFASRHQVDVACLMLLHDAEKRTRVEMAMNANDALPR